GAKGERLGRHFRQLIRDQRGAAMMCEGIKRPIALDGAQLLGCIPDRLDRDMDRVVPNIGNPGDGLCRPTRQHEPAVAFDHIVAKLLLQLGEEALGSEIASQLGQWRLSLAKPDRGGERGDFTVLKSNVSLSVSCRVSGQLCRHPWQVWSRVW